MPELKKQRVSFGYGVIRGTIIGLENLTFLTVFASVDHSVYNIASHHTLMCTLLAMIPAVPVAISAKKKRLIELRRNAADT